MAEKVATFAVNLESNAGAVSATAAAELEALRVKIEASQVAIKGMGASLRALKGGSENVAAAKEMLVAKLDAERGALAASTLAVIKQGTSYEQLADKQRKAEATQRKLDAKKQGEDLKRIATSTSKMGEAVKLAGGPLSDMVGRFGELKGVLGGAGGAMGAVGLGAGLLVGGVVAVTGAFVDAGIKLGAFVLTSAGALRSMNLLREGVAGGSDNAKHLGEQVDGMSRKVATSKEELNKLAVAITRSMSGGLSKASGQAIVDEFAAVSQAAAASGDELGSTIEAVIARGKMWNRFSLTPFDMAGKGMQFGEVAAALAKNLGIGIDKAKERLTMGRVTLEQGAKAMRSAVESKFGALNASKLLDFDVQMSKLKEHLVGLTKDVNLEPILKSLEKILSHFDLTTESGQKIKAIFDKIAIAIGKFAAQNTDKVIDFLDKAIERAGRFVDKMDTPEFANLVGQLGTTASLLLKVADAWVTMNGKLMSFDVASKKLGAEIGKGVSDGFESGVGDGKPEGAIARLGRRIKETFEESLKIGSPSKVFEQYGRDTPAGYAIGVERGAPSAQAAIDAMAPGPPRGAAMAGPGGACGGLSSIAVSITVNVPAGTTARDADAIAKVVSGPSVLQELTRAIRDGLMTQGVPTGAAPS